MQELAPLTTNCWKPRAACHLNTCLPKGNGKCFLSFILLFLFLQFVHTGKQNELRLPCLILKHWSKYPLASGCPKRRGELNMLLPAASQKAAGEMSQNWNFLSGLHFIIYFKFTFTEAKTNAGWKQPLHVFGSTPVLREGHFHSSIFFVLSQSKESKFIYL